MTHIHNYHPETGEFVHTSNARQNPLEPDKVLVPQHATTLKPPAIKEGFARVFTGTQWKEVPDHRGETWFDLERNPVVIKQLGSPVEKDLMAELPPVPLADLKLDAIQSVLAEADRLAAQFVAGYTEAEQSTFVKRENEARAIQSGAILPKDATYLMKLAGGDAALVAGLKDVILSRSDLFEDVTVAVTHMRQQAQERIEAASDADALAEVLNALKQQAVETAAGLLARKAALDNG